GRSIFADNGFDPYLEDPATLWLIHWQLASDPRVATTWFWAMSHWHSIEFTKDQLISGLNSFREGTGHKPVSDNTLKRDVDCFVRTYVHSRQTKTTILEDSLDCPLVDLRLITELPDSKTYQFQRGPKPSLPNEVFIFALIEYWTSCSNESKADTSLTSSLAFERIAYGPGSPGRVFKLDEDSLASRLEAIEIITGGAYRYGETAGLKQVYRDSEKRINPFELLKSYYNSHSARAVFAG
ncbi:MAG: DUF4007 family protein, partial [Nitrososphaera sp.]|nr:DUF4007 family protein [Nitrososphaera sp.]